MSFLFAEKVHDKIREQRAQRTPTRQSAPGLQCLVIGSGGREHALTWRLLLDDKVGAVDVAPGNGGTSLIARNLDNASATDAHLLTVHAVRNEIDLAIVGPDDAIAAGVADELRRAGVPTVGPSREAAKVEWSKSFAKEVMEEAGVPTAPWWIFDDMDRFAEFARDRKGPLVVKADGLAAGKGVVVAADADAAIAAARACLSDAKFGDAGRRIVVEELLEGEEASLHALVDGDTVVALPSARDYKRAGDGDVGANTGGMGGYSPSTRISDADAQALARALISPVARELSRRGTPYHGILYAGLMFTSDGPMVIEYNARFGDPEAEVMLPRIGGDFSALLRALADCRLAEHLAEHPLEVRPGATAGVVVAAKDYPAAPTTGERIEGLFDMPQGTLVFHAGTRRAGESFLTSGGRVLHVVGRGATLDEARTAAYAGVDRISFPSAFHRSDIGATEARVP